MTVEEAGETLLENEPWITCPLCMGRDSTLVCTTCRETGVVIKPRYAEAYKTLGMKLPVNRSEKNFDTYAKVVREAQRKMHARMDLDIEKLTRMMKQSGLIDP